MYEGTGIEIPPETLKNPISISDFVIFDEKILKIIRSFNPKKHMAGMKFL